MENLKITAEIARAFKLGSSWNEEFETKISMENYQLLFADLYNMIDAASITVRKVAHDLPRGQADELCGISAMLAICKQMIPQEMGSFLDDIHKQVIGPKCPF